MDDLEAKWWKEWWEADYSWDGLAKIKWHGWYVDGPKPVPDPSRWPKDHENYRARPERAIEATLQDYWRGECNNLITCPYSRKQFTRIHLPLRWQDGSEIDPKLLAKATEEKQAQSLKNTLASLGQTKFDHTGAVIGPDHRAQWQGAVLRGINIDQLVPRGLHNIKLPIGLKADQMYVVGHAKFTDVVFEDNADFNNAFLKGEAWFNSTVFAGFANFTNTAFADTASFNNATFWHTASFKRTTFSGRAMFTKTAFMKSSSFMNATFADMASFDNANFLGEAEFSETTFMETATFTDAAFPCLTWFQNAVFEKEANFSGLGDGGSEMMARRSFKSIDATGAVFMGEAIFDNRDHFEPSSFRKCHFFREASFHGSKLHQGVSFHGAQFEASLNPERQCNDKSKGNKIFELPDHVIDRLFSIMFAPGQLDQMYENEVKQHKIKHQKITRDVWNKHIRRAHPDKVNWIDKKRAEAAEAFRNLPQDSALSERGKSKNDYFAGLEDCFRTLKLAMENNRNRPEEARFFKLELKARAKRSVPRTETALVNSLNPFSPAPSETHVPRWERWMSYLYGAVGDYGNSVMRPVGYVFGLTVICSFAYGMLGSLPRTNPLQSHEPELIEAFSFSLGRVIPTGPWAKEPTPCSPMGRLLNLPSTEIKEKANPASNYLCQIDKRSPIDRAWTALGVNFLATLQSLIAIILVFLSALAARRRFQIN